MVCPLNGIVTAVLEGYAIFRNNAAILIGTTTVHIVYINKTINSFALVGRRGSVSVAFRKIVNPDSRGLCTISRVEGPFGNRFNRTAVDLS